jgi:hypothetical protein
MPQRRVRLNTWLSGTAHRRFKVMSVGMGLSMTDMIERYIAYIYKFTKPERIKLYERAGMFGAVDEGNNSKLPEPYFED